MFGHNDDGQQQDQNQSNTYASPTVTPFGPPATQTSDTAAPDDNGSNGQADNVPLPGSSSLPESLTAAAPSEDASAAPAPATSAPTTPGADNGDGLTASPNDLFRIKQEALQKLSPLVDHLDQTPEERFRTTMMLIQATDDSSLIKEAYDTAQKISDEKVRAQALLDVVNEINYFSQQMNGPEHEEAPAV